MVYSPLLLLVLNFTLDNETSIGIGAVLRRFSTPITLFSVYSRFKLLRVSIKTLLGQECDISIVSSF